MVLSLMVSLAFLGCLTHLNAQKVQIVLRYSGWLSITFLLLTINSMCCHASVLASFPVLLCVTLLCIIWYHHVCIMPTDQMAIHYIRNLFVESLCKTLQLYLNIHSLLLASTQFFLFWATAIHISCPCCV